LIDHVHGGGLELEQDPGGDRADRAPAADDEDAFVVDDRGDRAACALDIDVEQGNVASRDDLLEALDVRREHAISAPFDVEARREPSDILTFRERPPSLRVDDVSLRRMGQNFADSITLVDQVSRVIMYLVENEPNVLPKDTDEEQLDAARTVTA